MNRDVRTRLLRHLVVLFGKTQHCSSAIDERLALARFDGYVEAAHIMLGVLSPIALAATVRDHNDQLGGTPTILRERERITWIDAMVGRLDVELPDEVRVR